MSKSCRQKYSFSTEKTVKKSSYVLLSATLLLSSVSISSPVFAQSVGGARPGSHVATPVTPSASQLNQILRSGVSTFAINGGSYSGDIQIPRGVTLVNLADKNSSSLNIQGSLVDSGRLIFRGNDVTQASLNAQNVFVRNGGMISALDNLTLNINALNNIVNAGTISSTGNLNLFAGNSISNLSGNGSSAVIQAANNLSMYVGAGGLVNTGLISAQAGNLSVNSATATQFNSLSQALLNQPATFTESSLAVTNTHGSIEALLGDISLPSGRDLTVVGGDFKSNSLNLKAGKDVNANVGEVTGVVNAEACNVHVFADSDDLKVGVWNVTSDPIIANAGNIALSDQATNGAPLVVVAGKDITWSNGITNKIDTSGASGGNLYLVAGAKFTPSPYPAGTVPITIQGPSSTGGKIDFSGSAFSGIVTDAKSNPGSAGNVEMSAFAGSVAGSGSIIIPQSVSISTLGIGTGSSGHIFAVAGASPAVASNPSIVLPDLISAGGTGVGSSGLSGGHVIISTTQPNVSATNPMVLDPADGRILQGGILGGPLANSSVSIKSISTGGGQAYILAGLGITSGGIETFGNSGRPGGAVNILAGATGKDPANSNVSVAGISTAGATGFPSGKVNVVTSGNISLTSNIDTQSVDANAGGVFLAAGSSKSSGNISFTSITTSASSLTAAEQSGSVVILTTSTCSTCTGHGTVTGTNITTSNASLAGSGAPITISATDAITLNLTNSQGSSSGGGGGGGSVFLTSANDITVANGIDTSAFGVGPQAGGVYRIAQGILAGPNPIQNQAGAPVPNNVKAALFIGSNPTIQGNALNVSLTFNGNTAPAAFNAGGYVAINDQLGTKKGGTYINLTVQNDNNVIIPIVSRSSTPFTLIGSATDPSGISANMSSSSSLLLFGAGGINVGSSNAFLTAPGASVPLTVVSSNLGNVVINNSNIFFRALNIPNAVTNAGTLSISSLGGLTMGAVVSGATPATGSSITLDALGPSSLTLTDSISAAAAVTLMPTGLGNVIEQTPSVIDASALIIGNANLLGVIGSTGNPIYADVNKLVVNASPNATNNGASITSLSDMTVSFNVGGVFQLTGGNPIILDNTKANVAGVTASITVGSIAALKNTAAVLSPLIQLTSTNSQGVGSASIPINIGNVTGNTKSIRLFADSSTAPLFISSTVANDIELPGLTSTGSLSISTVGNIILGSGVTLNSVGSMSLSTKAGIFAASGSVATLKAGTSLNLSAGNPGIGFGALGNGTILVQSTALNIQSAGSAVLAQSGDITFSGVSNVGKASTDSFSLLAVGHNITFSSGSSLNTPSLIAITSAGGAITQASPTAISVNSSQVRFDGFVVGGANPLGIKGGNLRLNTSSAVNLLSATGVTFPDMAIAGALKLEVQTGDIAAAPGVVPFTVLSSDVTLKIDNAGEVGSAAIPLVLDTGRGGNPLSLQVQASKGSVYIFGAPDLSSGGVGLSVKNSSAGSIFSVSCNASVTLDASSTSSITAGKSVSISTKSPLAQSGGSSAISSPVIFVDSGAGTASTILLSNLPGKTAPVDLTFVAGSSGSTFSGSSIRLVGSSTLSNGASATVSTTSGDISIAAGASVKVADGSASTLTLQSSSNITQAAKGTTLSVPTMNLTALGSNSSIGTSAINIGTSSGTFAPLLLNPDATGNVFVTNNGQVTLGQATATVKTYQVSTTGAAGLGTIQVGAIISATDVILHAGNGGGILVSKALSASNNLTLSAEGLGSVNGGAIITAKNLVVTTGSGSIGGGAQLVTAVSSTISANVTSGVSGSVNISNTGANVVLNNSSSGGAFSFVNSGTLKVNSVTSRAALTSQIGNIVIGTTGGTSNLNIAPSAKISTGSGSIFIQNANTTGLIDVGKGAKISTLAPSSGTGGSVSFLVGPAFGTLMTGQVLPAGLTIGKVSGGGTYSLGQTAASAVKVAAPGNVLNLIGQNILFDTGAGSPQLITLEGGVIITADPVNPAFIGSSNAASSLLMPTAVSSVAPVQTTSMAHGNNGTLLNTAFGSASVFSQLQGVFGFASNNSLSQNSVTKAGYVFTQPTTTGLDSVSQIAPKAASSGSAVILYGSDSASSYSQVREEKSDSHLMPISFSSSSIGLSTVHRAELTDTAIFSTPDVAIEHRGNELMMKQGTVILVPKADIQLHIGKLVCKIKKGVVLYARVDADTVEIVNLADKQRGQVELISPEVSTHLDMGKTFIYSSNSSAKMRSAFPVRNEIRHGGVLSADISLPYILTTELAKGLKASERSADRAAYTHVLKSCAAYVALNKKQGYALQK